MIRAAVLTLALALPGAALADPAQKVVSLGGSVTEIAVALGAQDRLIARDTTSNFPPEIMELPDVGYIRALSPEGVLSLGPDLIISEAGAGPVEAVDVLRAAGIPFVLMPGGNTAETVLAKIDAVAQALETPEAGARLHAEIAAGLDEAKARSAARTDKQSVLFILGLQGGRVTAGGTGSSAAGIIDLAGATNAATGFEGYKQMTDEAILQANPDVILMMQREGQMAVTFDDVRNHPSLASSPAVQNNRIYQMDGMKLLGFGPRTPAAALELYQAIYGE